MKHIQNTARLLPALPAALKSSAAVLAAVLAASFLTGCERRTHVYAPPAPQPDYFTELEPNDSPGFPDFVGYLDQSSFVVVEGHVEAFGFDIVDHIEFETNDVIEIDFTLEALGPYGDVDVTIYDPIANQIVGTYATDGRYETGTLIIHEAGRPFQFIIEAFDTDTSWSLELIGYPHGCACRTGSGVTGSGVTGSSKSADSEDGSDLDANVSERATALSPIVAKKEFEILRLGAD
jgi:hypothetical protein